MRFKVERHVFDNFVGFYMVDTDAYGRRFHPERIVLKEYEEGAMVPEFMEISEDDAQRLMDEMWNAGFRPSEGSGSAGALKAVQDHLADMQKIVFKFIK